MLDSFALVTYAVEPGRLARVLPDGIVADERGGVALISAVPFLDRDFAFRSLPFAKVSCGQVNYRAYVRDLGRRGDERGVWFFGTSLDSVFVLLPRIVWRMPWHRDRLRIDADWTPHCETYRFSAAGVWGSALLRLRGTGRPAPDPACFTDPADCRATLFDPYIGWYGHGGLAAGRCNGASGATRCGTSRCSSEEDIVDEAWFQVFHDLDLVDAEQAPLAAGVQRSVAFDVHTPPTRVR